MFKDVWRDECRGSEGELYAKAFVDGNSGDGVARLYSFSSVSIGGKADDTLNLIRKKVSVEGHAIRLVANSMYLFQDHTHEWSQDMYHFEEEDDYRSPCNRIHTRLVMSTFGWSVKYYKSLPELMGVMRDAIAGKPHASLSATTTYPLTLSRSPVYLPERCSSPRYKLWKYPNRP